MFARLEAARGRGLFVSYTLSQTSLEMVFNHFASQQEEETAVARGIFNT